MSFNNEADVSYNAHLIYTIFNIINYELLCSQFQNSTECLLPAFKSGDGRWPLISEIWKLKNKKNDGTSGKSDRPESVSSRLGVVDGFRSSQRCITARVIGIVPPSRARRQRRIAPGHARTPPRAPSWQSSPSSSHGGALSAVTVTPRTARKTQERYLILLFLLN